MPGWKKTVLRSIRLPTELEDRIAKDAEARGLSVNALVTSILTKYSEWDRYADKFGLVTITRAGLRTMIDGLDEESAQRIARETGSQNPREMTLFWFKKHNFDTFLSYLNIICRYGRIGEYEVEMDGRNCTILFHHGLGLNVSKYHGYFFTEAIREIVGVPVKTEAGRNTLVLKFQRP
jgi:hypothetical protein